jgi:HSP20 family protein
MAKATSKAGRATPVPVERPPVRHLFGLHQEIDHLFDDFFRSFRLRRFGRGTFDIEPFWRFESSFGVPVPLSSSKHTNR